MSRLSMTERKGGGEIVSVMARALFLKRKKQDADVAV